MRQVILVEPGQFVERQVAPPAPAPGEALVRIHRVGVCGSDFHAFAGTHPAYTFPRVIGHELACEIIDIPVNDKGIRPGDRCAIEPYLNCGRCRACSLNRPNCCEALRVFGVHVEGGMQGFLSVPVRLLHRSEILSFDQLALIETLGVGAHAVRRSALVAGESALVIGAGPIGLSVTQFALAAGATVRVVEKNECRRTFASQFGAEIMAEPDGQLSDVVFDATGDPTSMGSCTWLVAAGGRIVFVGLCQDPVLLDDALFHKREVTLYASRNSCHQFPRIVRMIEQAEIDTTPWIGARMTLTDVSHNFADLRKRTEVIKAIIEIDDSDTV